MTLPAQIMGGTMGARALDQLADQALACRGGVAEALQLATHLSATVPQPGSGSTPDLWSVLSSIAAADITVARVIEPHLDALAILHQAGLANRDSTLEGLGATGESTWGVFAAEAPDARLDATADGTMWRLSGRKPWCSLAGSLSHALVTAHTGGTARRLFAVSLRQPGVAVEEGSWHATGLAAVQSGAVVFNHVEAIPIGEDDWYLSRPGFAWGGIGVAACWWGGAVGIARRAFEAARDRQPDQIALMHLGAMDTTLHSAGLTLSAAATLVDSPDSDRGSSVICALRTRAAVAVSAEEVIRRVGHALGPAPLALEPDHARRVADLQLYLRQHHAERDDAALGGKLLTLRSEQW